MKPGSEERSALLERYRERLKSGDAAIVTRYRAAPEALRLLRERTELIDRLLCDLWQELRIPAPLAQVAVGGYGRREMWPASDIDLLILLPQAPDAELTGRLEQLISLFWDIGLNVGHSVRRLDECLEEAASDLTVQTALVESRWLCGDPALFATLRNEFMRQLDPQAFYHGKRVEQGERYLRYQESPYSLEPNVKESPGGLRDLQTILWIAQAAGFGHCWQDLKEGGFITEQEEQGVRWREDFLRRLRVELHLLVGRKEDRLLFDHQTAVAERMGLSATPVRRASEQLMQEYYQTAKTLTQLNTILLQNMGVALFPPPPQEPRPLNTRFQAVNQLLDVVHEDIFYETPEAILETSALMQQHAELKGLTARTTRWLWRARRLIDDEFRDNPLNKQRFIELFKPPRGVLHELRRLNQFDILGRYLPSFGAIVGQMQYDLFHAYTVDHHILQVLRNLRRFSETEFTHEYPFCSQLISEFERPWVLYIAALFHDIAKGRGGDHSELGAQEARQFCLGHELAEEDSELIVWLVRHHLAMSTFAQKHDISDPDVVATFTATVRDERRLTALYLFTVADIRGTSPKVWNSWKGQLLEELFRQSRQQLQSGGRTTAPYGIVQERKAEARSRMRGSVASERLWEQLDTAYFLRHSAEEIAWHARALSTHLDGEPPIVKARLNPQGDGIEVMAYTRDQCDLFARLAGFFARAGYNILDAKIHTTRTGYALDSFMLQGMGGLDEDASRLDGIERELAVRLSRPDPPEAPASSRLSRQVRHFPIQPQVSIQPDDKEERFVLSVSAADRPGLLYAVAATLAAHGANLHTAKIATMGERVEDTFLITGSDLADSVSRVKLETELLQRLNA